MKLWLEKNADISAKDNKVQTLLHFEAERGHTNCLELLLKNHGYINAKDNDGHSALHFAQRTGQTD